MNIHIPGYCIEEEIGKGATAKVYRAVQESLGRPVALKIMSPHLSADPGFGKRFLRGAKTSASLSHPNIVAIHDFGPWSNSYYLVMEMLSAGDLRERIRGGYLPPDLALTIIQQMAEALGYVHEQGFVHRDVKPENIMFRAAGNAVLTDFGVARALDGVGSVTGVGMTVGTPHYMSPEQAQGLKLDHRSDLYGLGVVLYEMLTGKVPFEGTNTTEVLLKHIKAPRPKLPKSVSRYQALLNRLLARTPERRFSNTGELIRAIRHPAKEPPLEQQQPRSKTKRKRLRNGPKKKKWAFPFRRFRLLKPAVKRGRRPTKQRQLNWKWVVAGAITIIFVAALAVWYQNRPRVRRVERLRGSLRYPTTESMTMPATITCGPAGQGQGQVRGKA